MEGIIRISAILRPADLQEARKRMIAQARPQFFSLSDGRLKISVECTAHRFMDDGLTRFIIPEQAQILRAAAESASRHGNKQEVHDDVGSGEVAYLTVLPGSDDQMNLLLTRWA